jgi:hypothetical protein
MNQLYERLAGWPSTVGIWRRSGDVWRSHYMRSRGPRRRGGQQPAASGSSSALLRTGERAVEDNAAGGVTPVAVVPADAEPDTLTRRRAGLEALVLPCAVRHADLDVGAEGTDVDGAVRAGQPGPNLPEARRVASRSRSHGRVRPSRRGWPWPYEPASLGSRQQWPSVERRSQTEHRPRSRRSRLRGA